MNKFLTERIAFGDKSALNYLVDEGAKQRGWRAGLVYSWLLTKKGLGREEIVRRGKEELNDILDGGWVNIDVESVLVDLEELGLFRFEDGTEVRGTEEAEGILRDRWTSLF